VHKKRRQGNGGGHAENGGYRLLPPSGNATNRGSEPSERSALAETYESGVRI
jgi:hypothetical protein